MKPENLVIKSGRRIIRVDIYNDYVNKKPTCLITCAENDEDGDYDEDGFIVNDTWIDASFYPNVEQLDQLIEKLKEAREFLLNNK